MLSLIYKVGTASVSTGSAIVSGTDTGWATARVTGGMFSCLGRTIPIASVESETSLTLAYEWPGPNFSGGYAIARSGSEAAESVFSYQTLTEVLRRAFLAPVQPNGVGTLTNRDNIDPQQLFEGYVWLRWEDSEPLELYFYTGEDWDGPYELKGDKGDPGTVSSLDDLSDVSLTTPTDGDGLVRDGGSFVNKPVAVTDGISFIVKLTQSEYDALPVKDDTTLYVIMEDEGEEEEGEEEEEG